MKTSTRIVSAEQLNFFKCYETRGFERDDVVIKNTYRQSPACPGSGMLGFVHEGLVTGKWHRSVIAPQLQAVAVVSGDGRWIGADAFKYGENLFRYVALAPSHVTLIPAKEVEKRASCEVLRSIVRSISLDWCSVASVNSMARIDLRKRVLLLLFDLCRLHPRPELELRQQDLADLLGVSRQTLNPILVALERDGLVAIGYSELVVDSSALDRALIETSP